MKMALFGKRILLPFFFFLVTSCGRSTKPADSNAKVDEGKQVAPQASANVQPSPTAAPAFDVERAKRELSARGYRLQYENGDPQSTFVMSTVRNCAVVFNCTAGQVTSIEVHNMAFDTAASNQEESFAKVKLGHDEVCEAAAILYPNQKAQVKSWYQAKLMQGLQTRQSSASSYFGPVLYNLETKELNVTVTVWPNR